MTRASRNQTLKRVKVYTLSDVWIDNGTGYCFGEVFEDKEPYLIVKNELDHNDELLRAKIEGQIQFQRQQDTLIVWTDHLGQNIALSFQEREGCTALCDFIIKMQRGDLAPQISLVSLISSDLDGDITELITGPINYPNLDPTSHDLPLILLNVNENINSSYQKSSISNFIKENNYISKLIQIFDSSEKNKKIKHLHLLCNILKTLILYNEGNIIELMLDDENILGVVGILEYDPDYPQYKADHRSFLQDDTRFKEVLPIKDDNIKNLIKKTFKLQFLKDVVLARLLDDPTFNLISTLIHYNQVEIIEFLEKGNFIEDLFQLYLTTEANQEVSTKKQDGIRLIHQFILISKNLQPHQKTSFYNSLIKKGLFKIIDYVLRDGLVEIRILGTEIIVSIIEHDVLLINGVVESNEINGEEREIPDHKNKNNGNKGEINTNPNEERGHNDTKNIGKNHKEETFNGDDYGQEDDENNDEFNDDDDDDHEDEDGLGGVLKQKNLILSDDMTLLMILTQFLLDDNDPGLKIQAFEALKSLLDPINNLNSTGLSHDEPLMEKLNTDNYFNAFYSKVAPKLFEPLIILKDSNNPSSDDTKDELLIHLCELIKFCSKDKLTSRSFFLENHIVSGISKMIEPTHKLQLRIAAVRYLKSIIQLNDDYYTRYIISNNSLKEVFNLLDESIDAEDLVFSTILDLLEIILLGLDKYELRKNFKLLASYIVSNFKSSLLSIKSVQSGSDIIKFMEQGSLQTSFNDTNEYDDNSNDKEEYENDSASTSNINIDYTEDFKSQQVDEDQLNITSSNSGLLLEDLRTVKHHFQQTNKTTSKLEKRAREEELIRQNEMKKRSTFKEKVQIASKKLASKFSSSK